MFCNQCEQTAKGQGCLIKGVCGKNPEVAALQDLFLYAIKGLSLYAHEARKNGLVDDEINRFTSEGLFTTLTNVNFDQQRFEQYIRRCSALTGRVKSRLEAAKVK